MSFDVFFLYIRLRRSLVYVSESGHVCVCVLKGSLVSLGAKLLKSLQLHPKPIDLQVPLTLSAEEVYLAGCSSFFLTSPSFGMGGGGGLLQIFDGSISVWHLCLAYLHLPFRAI